MLFCKISRPFTAIHNCEALRSTAKHCEALRSTAKHCEALRSSKLATEERSAFNATDSDQRTSTSPARAYWGSRRGLKDPHQYSPVGFIRNGNQNIAVTKRE